MSGRPVDLEAVRAGRARLVALAEGGRLDVPRLLEALRADGPTGREGAARLRAAVDELARARPELVTEDVRATVARVAEALEGFDAPDDEDP